MDARRFSEATARNREPILGVLERVVPRGARVLEIASGSGEHAIFLAARLGVAEWQPTDPSAEARASIDAWRAHTGDGARAVLPAMELDVHRRPWSVARVDVVVCINMIHIAPWSACEALFAGAAGAGAATVVTYGPYKRDGAHTAPSNAAFDESLQQRNSAWGVRDIADVTAVAERSGFTLAEVVAMPANNFTVVFRRE